MSCRPNFLLPWNYRSTSLVWSIFNREALESECRQIIFIDFLFNGLDAWSSKEWHLFVPLSVVLTNFSCCRTRLKVVLKGETKKCRLVALIRVRLRCLGKQHATLQLRSNPFSNLRAEVFKDEALDFLQVRFRLAGHLACHFLDLVITRQVSQLLYIYCNWSSRC